MSDAAGAASARRDPGSFRDPSGRVVRLGPRVLRSVRGDAAAEVRGMFENGLLPMLIERGLLARTWIAPDAEALGLLPEFSGAELILEHEPIEFITYPYEWSFGMLRKAALFHLDLQLLALEHGHMLRDATAYNLQFRGATPLFIDVLSLRRYRDGELWEGHQQFMNQFVHPLLLTRDLGIAHHQLFRGGIEGVTGRDLVRMLGLRQRLSPRTLLHVVLPERLNRRGAAYASSRLTAARARRLPKAALAGMLGGLRSWIASFEPRGGATTWSDYVRTHNYSGGDFAAKRDIVASFVRRVRPHTVLDLGCNTGEFSAVALQNGASRAVGIDGDTGALEQAFARAERDGLDLLAVFADAADPPGGQGWRNLERGALTERIRCDALLALAVIHHLAIGRNIPLADVVDWLCDLAPSGVIEWVPKSDPQVQRLLALRQDVFADYDAATFEAALRARATIEQVDDVGGSGRRIYGYRRHG